MMPFVNFLTGATVGTLAIWVNKIIGLFAGSNLALRDWQGEADATAAAFGTGVAFVTAAIAVFVPRWLRIVLAILFLGGSLYLGWRCSLLHEVLVTTKMATPESDALRHDWRLSYIGMLLSFVAAITCAAASMWPEKTPPDDTQPAAAPGTQPP